MRWKAIQEWFKDSRNVSVLHTPRKKEMNKGVSLESFYLKRETCRTDTTVNSAKLLEVNK